MPEIEVVEEKWFRRCMSPRCPIVWVPVEQTACPVCEQFAPLAHRQVQKTVREVPEPDWTHGEGYEKADRGDIGL